MIPTDKPWHALLMLCGAQLALWTLIPALSYHAPPLDVVEGYMWGKELVLGTYKHPALPSWMLEISRQLTDTPGWPAYLTSQLFIVATFIATFMLGRDLIGETRALAGVAILTGVVAFSWTTPNFNHDVALMPIWAGFIMALWRAVERNTLIWWCVAAALAATGIYTKFTVVAMLVTAACWLLWDVKARGRLAQAPAWISFLLFVVLVSPMAIWLRDNGHHLAEYAADSAYGRSALESFPFILAVLASAAGVPLLIFIAALRLRRTSNEKILTLEPASDAEARARRYLAAMTFGPMLLMLLIAKFTGSGLRTGWTAPLFCGTGLLAMTFIRPQQIEKLVPIVYRVSLYVLLLVAVSHAVYVPAASRLGRPDRASWPAAEISRRMHAAWQNETGLRLKIVAGEPWVAGLVGIGVRPMPSIFTFGEFALAPWITPERLADEGALIVWGDSQKKMIAPADGGAPLPPPKMQALIGDLPIRAMKFIWPLNPKLPEIVIGYAILPPSTAPVHRRP